TYDSNFHEVNSHYTMLNHVYATGSIVINDETFEGYSDETKAIFEEVGKEVEEWQVAENRKEVETYTELMKDEGVNFTELSDEEVSEFQEFGVNQWDDYADVYGQDRIDQLREEVEALN